MHSRVSILSIGVVAVAIPFDRFPSNELLAQGDSSTLQPLNPSERQKVAELSQSGSDTFEIWPKGQAPGVEGVDTCRSLLGLDPKPTHEQLCDKYGCYDAYITVYHATVPPLDGATAVLVFPGGGFMRAQDVGDVPSRLAQNTGITAVYLKYRAPAVENGSPYDLDSWTPIMDAQRAISMVRYKAADWNINPNRIGVLGSSAGGGLAIALATMPKRRYDILDEVDDWLIQPPAFVGLLYASALNMTSCCEGMIKDAPNTSPQKCGLVEANGSLVVRGIAEFPPAWIGHATDDTLSPVESSEVLYEQLKQAGIPAELHIYTDGSGHGFIRKKCGSKPEIGQACLWMSEFEAWLEKMDFLDPPSEPKPEPAVFDLAGWWRAFEQEFPDQVAVIVAHRLAYCIKVQVRDSANDGSEVRDAYANLDHDSMETIVANIVVTECNDFDRIWNQFKANKPQLVTTYNDHDLAYCIKTKLKNRLGDEKVQVEKGLYDAKNSVAWTDIIDSEKTANVIEQMAGDCHP